MSAPVRSRVTLGAALLVLPALPADARAQARCTALDAAYVARADSSGRLVVAVDHAARGIRLVGADTSPLLCAGQRVEPRGARRVVVRAVGTNTAFHQPRLEAGRLRDPFREPVTQFLGNPLVKRFLPELGLLASGARGRGGDVEGRRNSILPEPAPSAAAPLLRLHTVARRVESELAQVDAALHADSGVVTTYALTLAALERMRGGADPEREAAQLRSTARLRPAERSQWMTRTLATVTASLARDADSLGLAATDVEAVGLLPVEYGVPVERLRAAADSAQRGYAEMLAFAYRTEALALTVARARATSALTDDDGVALEAPSRIGVRFEPRTEPEIARVAGGPAELTVDFVRDPFVRPSLGVAAVFSPSAEYATWSTRSVTGGAEIFRNGTRDARFGYGLSFGTGWRPIDRLLPGGVSVLLPELVLAMGDVRGIGLGGAIGWRAVKLGAGAWFVRRTILDGQVEGQVIPNRDFLQTRDTYAPPAAYVSLSINGVPLFGGTP